MTSPTPPKLLAAGALAGPLYVLVGTGEAVLRSGFDIRRHALSLMSNGDLGWIQITTFIASGLLVIAGAVGIRRTLRTGPGTLWGPVLLAIYGLGLIGAGIFVADPMDGFPPGTPPGPPATMSWHGPLHFMAGGIGFIGLIGGCWVFARRFAKLGQSGQAVFSGATGLAFLVAFAAIASGTRSPWINLGFTAAVVLSWIWHAWLHRLLRAP